MHMLSMSAGRIPQHQAANRIQGQGPRLMHHCWGLLGLLHLAQHPPTPPRMLGSLVAEGAWEGGRGLRSGQLKPRRSVQCTLAGCRMLYTPEPKGCVRGAITGHCIVQARLATGPQHRCTSDPVS